MQIRQVDVSIADARSAKLFFDALTGFYDFSSVDALDMFARNGQLTLCNYVHAVKAADAWELCPDHAQALRSMGAREIRIGCSYRSLEETQRRYGLIVVDTPQGVHANCQGERRVEHFGVLDRIDRLVAERAVIVLYVNRQPYDKAELGEHGYDRYEDYDFGYWMNVRSFFYSTDVPDDVSEERALGAYRRRLSACGLRVVNTLTVPCHSDVAGYPPYAFRLALEVER